MSGCVTAMVGIMVLAMGCAGLPRPVQQEPFSIVVLPDTQHYSARNPKFFLEQTTWIKEQKEALNIIGVVHEGDITDGCTPREWDVADQAMSVLDGAIPYCMAMGNHDYAGGKPARRDASLFNQHFGSARFTGKPWYGGHFEGGNENAFYTLQGGGMDLLVVCLEFGPREEVLAWANQVIAGYPRHKAIIVTHSYMYSDDTRVGKGDAWNPRSYGCENDGEDMWEKLVRKNGNIFLVLSGHILHDGLGRLASTNDAGRPVAQLLANYQVRENGGNGWLRVLTFRPAQKKIEVSTYSPVLKQCATDADNAFELEWLP